MTRKDFEAIATALRAVKPSDTYPIHPLTTWADCVDEIGKVCAGQNSQFDRERFRAACGVK